MKPITSGILFFFITATLLGQAPTNKSLSLKIAQLKTLLDESGNMSPEVTDSLDVNNKTKIQLSEILLSPEIGNYNLEKEFKGTNIGTTHSKDNRLWFFTWYENTGGSFKSNLTVIQYKTKYNKHKLAIDSSIDDTDDTETIGFNSNGASYDQIIKLPSKNKNLYLCLGGVMGCNTCFARVATVIELTANGINLDYHAFKTVDTDESGEVIVWKPTYIMDSRVDDIKTFEYDVKTQSIRYSYVPDDCTPIRAEDDAYNANTKPIKGHFKWNGTRFIGSTAGGHQ